MSGAAELLALCRVKGISWHFIARQAQRPDGLSELRAGRSAEKSVDAREALRLIELAGDELDLHQERKGLGGLFRHGGWAHETHERPEVKMAAAGKWRRDYQSRETGAT